MKVSRLFLFVGLIFSLTHLKAQNSTFQWAFQSKERANYIAVDTNNNILRTGLYYSTVDLDPGIGVENHTSLGGSDICIQKLDSNGHLIWAKSIGGIEDEYGGIVTTDNSGNVYISGTFQETVDFDPGTDVFNLTSGGELDMFILKLNPDGNFIWAKSMSGVDGGYVFHIAVDSLGLIYLTGNFEGICDFDPGPNMRNLLSQGLSDIFVQKLDPDGNLIYAKQFGSNGSDFGTTVSTIGDGNVYVSGAFNGTVDFNPGADTLNLHATGVSDAFILKLDEMGNFIWVKQLNTNYWLYESCYIVTDEYGHVYAYGIFNDIMDANPNSDTNNIVSLGVNDVFIIKLTSEGEYNWAKQIGGSGEVGIGSLQVMPNGDLLSAGGFIGFIDFDLGSGTSSINALTSQAFLQRLDSDGNSMWLKTIGGVDSSTVYSIMSVVGKEGYIYTTGSFINTVDFDPGAGVFTMYGDDTNGLNYLQKLRPCNLIQSIDEIEACDSYTWIDGNTYTQDNNTATYHYVGGAANGCDSVVLLNLTIQLTHGSTTNNIGSTIIASNNFASYVWLDCNNNYAIIPGETMQSYTSITGGSFAVELTENGCVDTSNCVSVASIGLIDNTFSSLYTIYPNPTQGEFTIEFNDKQELIVARIYNTLGQEIQCNTFENKNVLTFKISKPNGLYIVELKNNQGEKAQIKLFKQ